MQPTYQSDDGAVTLFRADCLDVLSELEPDSIGAVITDPPFGINFDYHSEYYNDHNPDYGTWLWDRIEKAEALCCPGAPLFVWQAMSNIRHLHQWFPRDWRLFSAAKNFTQIYQVPMQYAWDPVVVWWVPGEPWVRQGAGIRRDWYIANTIPSARMADVSEHPSARPLDLLLYIIANWVRPGDIVLDPFMGSGITGIAAIRLGRRFIGIEIEPRYYDAAQHRILEATQQPRLMLDSITAPDHTHLR